MQSIYFLLGLIQGGYFALWMPKLLERGLDLSQIAMLLAIDVAISTLVDLPTGVLADRIGHKRVTLIGFLILLFAFAIPSFHVSALALAAGIITLGIANAFINGALEAWTADVQLALDGSLKTVPFLRRDQIQRVGVITGSLGIPGIATFFWSEAPRLTWATFLIPAVILIWIGTRTTTGTTANRAESLATPAPTPGFIELLRVPGLGLMVVSWAAFGVATAITDLCFLPRLREEFAINASAAFGLIQATVSASRILGAEAWSRWRKLDSTYTPALSLFLASVMFLGYAMTQSKGASLSFWYLRVIALSAYFATINAVILRNPLFQGHRAAVLSIATVAGALGQIGANLWISSAAVEAFSSLSIWGALATSIAAGSLAVAQKQAASREVKVREYSPTV